ncbi:MAG: hypothetical protein RL591_1289 [Planctomycetota bacterium]
MSIRSMKKFAAVAAVAAGIAQAASAGLIAFNYTGVASGTIGASAFSGATFVITGFSDTNFVAPLVPSVPGLGYVAPIISAQMSLTGYGTFGVTGMTSAFVNNWSGSTGFTSAIFGDVFSFQNSAFSTWNMQSSIGPLSGTAQGNSFLPTAQGNVQFSGTFPITFSANVVPAPGAIALLGLAGLAKRRRR